MKTILLTWHGNRPRANVYTPNGAIRRYWLSPFSLRRVAKIMEKAR